MTQQIQNELLDLVVQGVDLPYSIEEIAAFEELGLCVDISTGNVFRPEDYRFELELTVLGDATAVVLESEAQS
jgi:hypothetical protein